jgi:hypothetical protein
LAIVPAILRALKAVHDNNWGDAASVLGVLISLIGFTVTLVNLWRSRSAAKQVADAVGAMRRQLSLQSAAVDLTALMGDIEEIKLLHRFGAWDAMPMRYSSIRRRLFSVKGSMPNLTKSQKASIQGVIEQFHDIEGIVETALARKEAPKDVAGLNRLAAEQSDKLTSILVVVQQEIGASK